MKDEQKIQLVDRLLESLKDLAVSEDMPVMVGTLSKSVGLNGFQVAEVGHPVFEHKDRYIIYLESKSPQMITQHGKQVEIKEFKIAVPYYKPTLKPIINFTHDNTIPNT